MTHHPTLKPRECSNDRRIGYHWPSRDGFSLRLPSSQSLQLLHAQATPETVRHVVIPIHSQTMPNGQLRTHIPRFQYLVSIGVPTCTGEHRPIQKHASIVIAQVTRNPALE